MQTLEDIIKALRTFVFGSGIVKSPSAVEPRTRAVAADNNRREDDNNIIINNYTTVIDDDSNNMYTKIKQYNMLQYLFISSSSSSSEQYSYRVRPLSGSRAQCTVWKTGSVESACTQR